VTIRFPFAISSLALVSAVGWSETAAAQVVQNATAVAAPDAEEGEDAAAILVTGRKVGDTVLTFGVPLEEAPLVVNTISEELIRDTAALRLRDLLVYVPGVTANENSGASGDRLTIRGFETSRVPSVNGLRRPTNFDNASTDLQLIERIEIIKGPAGLEFGVTDPGGLVNFITKKPQDSFALTARAAAGSFDTYQATVDVTGPVAPDLAARLIVNWEDAESFRDTLDTSRLSVAPSLRWTYGEGSSLLVETAYLFRDQPYDRGIFYLENPPEDAGFNGNFAPRNRSFHEPTDSLKSEIFRGAIYWQQQLVRGLRLNVAVEGNRDEFDSLGPRNYNLAGLYVPGTNRWNGTGRTVTRGDVEFNGSRDGYIVQSDLDGEIALGNVVLAARAGYVRSEVDFTQTGRDGQTRWNIDAFAPVYGTRPEIIGTVETIGRDFLSVTEIVETAWFAGGNLNWNNRLRIFAGVREDDFSSVNDYIDNVTRRTPLVRTTTANRALSWRTGLSFDLTPSTILFFGASRSEIPQSGFLRETGGIVPPLEATSFEGGIRAVNLGGWLTGSASVFEITQNNQTVADPDSLPGESFVINVGEVRVRGAEFDITLTPGAGFTILAGGAYLDSRILTRAATGGPGAQFGNRFFNTPEWQGFIRADWDAASVGLEGASLNLGIIREGDRFGNNANDFVLPAFTRVDAGAAYAWRNVELRLFVENLFDEIYYLGSQNQSRFIAPGAPRRVTGAVSFRW
jgi:iron complex outermembrane receptor protein